MILRARALASALILSLLVGSGAAAQTPAEVDSPAGDTLGTYVVRPGDTLKGITARFLGDDSLWRENWRLNPNLSDPHLLIPGQTLRIILDRKLPPRTVQVTMVARTVDQKPSPNPWTGAEIGDLLQEEDGLRTGDKASAEVLFDDETKLQLTEQSLIFLRRIGSTLRGVPQETVEIVEGQADLTATASRGEELGIELILGETTAKPTLGPSGRVATRARQAAGGDVALMVYAGKSAVAAGGAEVQVPTGMGTTVPPGGGPPTAPEKLLPAARSLAPRAGTSWGYANPRLTWQPVRGAASYTVEVCRDPSCSALVDRVVGLVDPEWTPETLPMGNLHWRVTAVASSGLDGYPSTAVPFSITSNRTDDAPPVVVTLALGNPAYDGEKRAQVGPGAAVMIAARDDASGVASVEYRWDDGAWRSWRGGLLPIPAEPGTHRLETRATDLLGRTSDLFAVSIDHLAETPLPPEVFATPSVGHEPPKRHAF